MNKTTVSPKKRRAWNTTVFMKQAMALSGLFFVFFVLMHSYGNLKIFAGPNAYNEYAHHLRTFLQPILPYEGLLWILRVILVVLIVVHVGAAGHLWHRSAVARGSRYEVKKNAATAYAARTMRWGGILLAMFIVFHLMHFTTKHFQIGDTAAYAAGVKSPALMMYTSFSNWWMVLGYGICVGTLALHIAHGVWSALQTMGWIRANTRYVTEVISGLVGLLIFALFMLPPLAILTGFAPPLDPATLIDFAANGH